MTREQDIERDLDRWFTEGPTRMPERLFDAVVDRIERVPQRRFARLRMKVVSLHIAPTFAAAAATVVVAAGLGAALVLTQPSGVGTTTAPSPSVREWIPDSIVGDWVPLGPRPLPSKFPAHGITITLTKVVLKVDSQPFENSIVFHQPDRLELAFLSTNDYLGCRPGDHGAYTFVVSSGVLTLNMVNDTCPARAGVLAGSWTRMTGATTLDGLSSEAMPVVGMSQHTP